VIKVSDVLRESIDSPLLSDLRTCYSIDLNVSSSDLDGFGHVNNANYIQWLDQVHWSHLAYMGITGDMVTKLNCGFVVRHTDVTYLNPLVENDTIRVGCSIIGFDKNFRLTRQFQLVRLSDSVTVLKGEILYVSIDIQKGKLKRIPKEYSELIIPHVPTVHDDVTI
jgi:acyl-CoA thioester hydrolase